MLLWFHRVRPMPPNENSGCLGMFLKFLGTNSKPQSHYAGPTSLEDEILPFRVRDDFLSHSELSFYHVLKQVVADRAVICPKVRIIDVLFVKQLKENYSLHNRVEQKHLDFLLCQPDSMTPLAAIELDDSSHNQADRIERDEFVNRAFKAAAFPLLRVPARHAYGLQDLALIIEPIFNNPSVPVTSPPELGDLGAQMHPDCPKCGTPMTLRVAKKGEHTGDRFYGCSNYPRCRETKKSSPSALA